MILPRLFRNSFTISWKPIALTHVDVQHFVDPFIHPDFIVLGQVMLLFFGQGCSSSWSQKIRVLPKHQPSTWDKSEENG